MALALGPSAASAAQVDVAIGDRTRTISAAEIRSSGDVAAANWGHAAAGAPAVDALSLRKLVELTDGDLSQVRGIEARGPAGATVSFDGGALDEPPPFGSGPPVPPLVWADDAGVHLARSAPDGTVAERLDVPTGGTLQLTVDGGVPLDVTASAGAARVRRGERVTFTARAPDASGAATYRWEFSDGRTAKGREVGRRATRAGVLEATVTVSDGSRGGTSEPIAVRVGRAAAPTARRDRPAGEGASGRPAPGTAPAGTPDLAP